MPKIYLKPNSAEFANHKDEPYTAKCDMPGCTHAGEHKAPKNRGLNEYYWFCMDHIREYNKAWNYYAGMSAEEIEWERRKDTIWQRPTWPFSRGDSLGGAGSQASSAQKERARPGRRPANTAECHAASTLGLETPYTKASLKSCYRSRAKAAHPDLNPDDPRAEERFKELREAYMTLLRPLST